MTHKTNQQTHPKPLEDLAHHIANTIDAECGIGKSPQRVNVFGPGNTIELTKADESELITHLNRILPPHLSIEYEDCHWDFRHGRVAIIERRPRKTGNRKDRLVRWRFKDAIAYPPMTGEIAYDHNRDGEWNIADPNALAEENSRNEMIRAVGNVAEKEGV